jgi:YVTN family beta-propeller protein
VAFPFRRAENGGSRQLATFAAQIAITPDGKTAYVTNYASGTVTPIRTATNTALRAVKVGTHPVAIALTP